MHLPQKVVWSQGLLMTPQHLQQADRYHERLVAARLDAVQPLNWGVVRLSFDRRALQAGEIRIDHFIGVLPAGTVLSFDASHAELPESRAVEPHLDSEGQRTDVYLAVARERDGDANYDAGDRRARYRIETRQVEDLVGEADRAEVHLARRNVVLLFGDEQRDDYECMKVAEVVRDQSGGYRLVDDYVPPCLSIGASPYLVERLGRLTNLMKARQEALAAARRERDDASVGFEQVDITRYLLLQAIGTHVPVLDHVVQSADLPPREVYMLLLQMAGALGVFGKEAVHSLLPFRYDDLRASFDGVLDRLESLLQSSTREHCIAVPLEGREDGMHLAELEDDRLAQCERVLIAVRTDVPETDAGRLVPSLGKMASWSEIQSLLSAAASGARLQINHRPPPEVPVKAGELYFDVELDRQFWLGIVRERTVAVFLPRPFDPSETKVQLIAIPRRSGGAAASQRPAAVAPSGPMGV